MSAIRFEVAEKFRYKKVKTALLQKREFLDFAIRKFAESTKDDGKSLTGWKSSDYFGMQELIAKATNPKIRPLLLKFSSSSIATNPYLDWGQLFDLGSDLPMNQSLPNFNSWSNFLPVQDLFKPDNLPVGETHLEYISSGGSKCRNEDIYNTIWDALMLDATFVAELNKRISQLYKAVRRLYLELFHSHFQHISITYDLSKYYEYFDLITTLRKGSEFVQTSTNSVKMADTSRKPFIKNGKSRKFKIYSLAV